MAREDTQVDFSIVVPVYNGELTIAILVDEIEEAIKGNPCHYEIILVEDYSRDKSWEAVEAIAKSNKNVQGIKLSRNFGQHYAITAGLDAAVGEWVVVMDCDLQDDPKEIPSLYAKAMEGYDIVVGKRVERKDNFFKKAGSRAFYRILQYLTGIKQDATIGNFGIYHKKVIDSIISMREPIRYFPTMVQWVGFKRAELVIAHRGRETGKSNYTFRKLLNLSLEIILVNSEKPIFLMLKFGFIVSFLSLCLSIITVIRYFSGYIKVMGYASIILVITFFSGLILAFLGIIG
ncbi:MAG: glycosyltransferase family 2 protein, partial [Chitinophagaceae bacterium]